MEHGSATERGRKYVNLRRTTGKATDQSIGRRCVGDGAEYVGALRECRRALEREVVGVRDVKATRGAVGGNKKGLVCQSRSFRLCQYEAVRFGLGSGLSSRGQVDRRTNGPCDQWFLFVVCLATKSTRMRHRIVLAIVVDRVERCGHVAIPDPINALPGKRGHALCLLAFRVDWYPAPSRGYGPGHCGE